MDLEQLVHVVEALIFAAGEPLTIEQLKNAIDHGFDLLPATLDPQPASQPENASLEPCAAESLEVTPEVAAAEIACGLSLELLQEAVDLLQARDETTAARRGFLLFHVAGGYTFRSNPQYAKVIRALKQSKKQRLSKAAMETLAIIAYQQPVTKPDVDALRGVDSAATFKVLLEKNLVRIVGKKEEPGRSCLYGTTQGFLSIFHLADLNQLPQLREIADIQSADDSTQGLTGLMTLSQTVQPLQQIGDLGMQDLEEALQTVEATEQKSKEALQEQGVKLSGILSSESH